MLFRSQEFINGFGGQGVREFVGMRIVRVHHQLCRRQIAEGHDQLDHFWQEQGVPHLDLLATFSNLPPAKLMVNAHDAHPNEFAHALAAEAIDVFLKRQITNRSEGDAKVR